MIGCSTPSTGQARPPEGGRRDRERSTGWSTSSSSSSPTSSTSRRSPATLGTTEYHLRRMFSSLAGMPLSEYVRRRRMTVAAADVVRGRGRPAEHRGPARVRLDRGVRPGVPGGPRRRAGRRTPRRRPPPHTTAAQVPPDRRREHPHGHPHRRPPRVPAGRPRRPRAAHPPAASTRTSSSTSPPLPARGAPAAQGPRRHRAAPACCSVSDDVDPDGREGTELTYLHGVAVAAGTRRARRPRRHRRPGRHWAVFRTAGPHPQTLQETWAATATEWFPSNPWRLRPGPSIVAFLERADDFTTATCELWLPVERA